MASALAIVRFICIFIDMQRNHAMHTTERDTTMNANVTALRTAIANAFAARKSAELSADASNSNMQKNLDKYAKNVDHDSVVTVLLACNFDVAAINQNAYAVEKMIKIARCAVSVDSLDVYTNATIRSMIACEAQEIEITRDVIASFCSVDAKNASAKVERAIKATRVQDHKSQSTVATQHNSTINAMIALHMLNVTRNASNKDVFKLNRENAAIKKIAERFELSL